MESAQAPLTKYTICSTITNVEQRYKNVWTIGVGPEAIFHQKSLGWFVHMQGSHEAIYVGEERPDLHIGEPVKITIEGIPHAKP